MGQNLSEPVTEKTSEDGGDERLVYGVASMQGWRYTMEDAHAAVLDLHKFSGDGDSDMAANIESKLSLFGVYDGHGGERVAQYAGENTHRIIARQEAFKHGHIEQALKDGFLATDRALLDDPMYESEPSGCTATVGIISSSKIYMANAGDSRGVLGVKGRAKPLSFDHKPMNEGEKTRIIAAGGTVEFGRVNGNLALSRAIGDFEFKRSSWLAPEQQIVTVYPDIIIHDIAKDDEFLVIACDGIWDCQSSQAVVEFVRRGIAAKQDLSKICENMMDNCLSSSSESGGVGCDNMTILIIGILHGMSKEEWYEEIAKRVSDEEIARSDSNEEIARSDSNEEIARSDSNEEIARSDSNEEMARSDSNEEMARSGSNEEMARSDSNEEMARSDSNEEMARSDSNEEIARGDSNEDSQRLIVEEQSPVDN